MAESQNIEWKQSWHDDYLKWICGFANAVGGRISIGKNDAGIIVNLSDTKKLLEDIPSKIKNHLGIICEVNLLGKDDSQFLEIVVPPYSVPISLRGRYYYRTGSTTVELTGNALNEFLLKKAGKTWDDVFDERATIDDIDTESVNHFLSVSEKNGRMPDVTGLTIPEILEKLRLIEGVKIKRAAIILFGKDPLRFYPNVFVKIGRFGISDSDLRFQEVVEGNLISLQHTVVDLLFNKFLVKNVSFEGMLRIEKSEYPIIALREMILNALVHRTYMGAMVQMKVYDNKISVWNEGALPQNITIENLKQNHISIPRNPLIADVCFKAGFIDSWGRGTLKIYETCAEAHLPVPEIQDVFGGIMVTLYKNDDTSKLNTVTQIDIAQSNFDAFLNDCRKEFGSISFRTQLDKEDNINFLRNICEVFARYLRGIYGVNSNELEKLNERLLWILMLLEITPKISRQEIARILGVSLSAIEKDMAILRKRNILEHIGSDKTGNWIVKKSSV